MCLVYIVGVLGEHERKKTFEEASQWASLHRHAYFEVNLETGFGLTEVLTSLVDEIKQREIYLIRKMKKERFRNNVRPFLRKEELWITLLACFIVTLGLTNIISYYLVFDMYLHPSTLGEHIGYYSASLVLLFAQMVVTSYVIRYTKKTWRTLIGCLLYLIIFAFTVGFPIYRVVVTMRAGGKELANRFGYITSGNAVLSFPVVILFCYLEAYFRPFCDWILCL